MCVSCIDCSRDIAVYKHGNCEQLSESFIKHTHSHRYTRTHTVTVLKVIAAATASALNPLFPFRQLAGSKGLHAHLSIS